MKKRPTTKNLTFINWNILNKAVYLYILLKTYSYDN